MATLTVNTQAQVLQILKEVTGSARYLVNAGGSPTDVVVSLAAWEKLLAWLEALDDRVVAQEWLPRLQAGPTAAGALPWADISEEWTKDDEPEV